MFVKFVEFMEILRVCKNREIFVENYGKLWKYGAFEKTAQ